MRTEREVNEAIDRYADLVRRICFVRLKTREDSEDVFQTVFEEAAGMETEDRDLLAVVLSLPEKYRDVIYLHYYEGYSAVEIGKLLGRSENTVYTWLSRARAALKDKLGGDWP